MEVLYFLWHSLLFKPMGHKAVLHVDVTNQVALWFAVLLEQWNYHHVLWEWYNQGWLDGQGMLNAYKGN